MKVRRLNIWDKAKYPLLPSNVLRCITTNGFVKNDGSAVMGAGVAKQAAERYPGLANFVGLEISTHGNHVRWVMTHPNLATFPVKHHWKQPADLDLIKRSVRELEKLVAKESFDTILIPKPGCGNGGLSWKQVKPLMEHLDDRFVVVSV